MKRLVLATLTTLMFSSTVFAGEFAGTWSKLNAKQNMFESNVITIEQKKGKAVVHKNDGMYGKRASSYSVDGNFLKYEKTGKVAYALEDGVLVGKHADISRYTKQ